MKLRSSVFGWKSVWMELAEEWQGEFIDDNSLVTLRLPHTKNPWKVTFQLHAHGKPVGDTTVIAVPFVARHPFKFAIRHTNSMEELAKVFGMQDIVVGDPEFDKDYIIQGNHPEHVIDFFSNTGIKDLIKQQSSINLSIMDSRNKQYGIAPPSHENVLLFVEKGTINSFDRNSSLYELMHQTLDHLHTIGVAAFDKPSYVV
jgi:hypothetical protein